MQNRLKLILTKFEAYRSHVQEVNSHSKFAKQTFFCFRFRFVFAFRFLFFVFFVSKTDGVKMYDVLVGMSDMNWFDDEMPFI